MFVHHINSIHAIKDGVQMVHLLLVRFWKPWGREQFHNLFVGQANIVDNVMVAVVRSCYPVICVVYVPLGIHIHGFDSFEDTGLSLCTI